MREALYAFMEANPGGAFRRDEVGRYVCSLFEQERSEVRARVTEFMANHPHPGKDRTSGHFGFAGHDDPVCFRNIQIKRL